MPLDAVGVIRSSSVPSIEPVVVKKVPYDKARVLFKRMSNISSEIKKHEGDVAGVTKHISPKKAHFVAQKIQRAAERNKVSHENNPSIVIETSPSKGRAVGGYVLEEVAESVRNVFRLTTGNSLNILECHEKLSPNTKNKPLNRHTAVILTQREDEAGKQAPQVWQDKLAYAASAVGAREPTLQFVINQIDKHGYQKEDAQPIRPFSKRLESIILGPFSG